MAKRTLSTMLVPPLKAPLEHDVKKSLASWLDETNNNCGFLSSQVQADLERISGLRESLVKAGNDYQKAQGVLDHYEEYHAALLECEVRGFPSKKTATSSQYLQFPWKTALSFETEVHSHLTWERANVLWNVAAVLSYQASIQKKRDQTGWNHAHVLLQAAASTLQHLIQLEEDSADFVYLSFWKAFLLAQAQIATYYMALASPKPRHVVLAKLASAAVPLLNGAYRECPESQESYQIHCKAWNTWILSLAQYHESCVHRQKKQWDLELARLHQAREAIACCQELVYQSPPLEGLEMLQGEVPKMVRTIRDRLLEAQHDFGGKPAGDLREIRGEVLVKPNLPLAKELTTLKRPLFRKVKKLDLNIASQEVIMKFQGEMDGMVDELTRVGEEKMEEARMTLANVNLPHSLTAYKQEQSGGGIPMELWERIEVLQADDLLSQIKCDSWELLQLADSAMSIHNEVSKQLAEDIELDRRFREQNPRFDGHDLIEVLRPFRASLKNYETLLAKSRAGDAVLERRVESVDTDPKYKLLQFQKSQLDRLLPAGNEGVAPIDTSRLARLLVALSSLFDEREELLHKLRAEARNYDIAGRVAVVDPRRPTAKRECERVVQTSFKSLAGIAYNVRTNISRQVELVESILEENEHFVAARDAGTSPNANESCIVMIEDAMEEAEKLRKHLKEGKEFYNMVIPKLEHLKHEVCDASVRLAVERCEYEDNAQNRHQESKDARLAASLARDSPSCEASNRNCQQHTMNGHDRVPLGHESMSEVDDSKVAHLLAMDFDPEKVVAALKKHNNDMDLAINDLLS